MRKKRWLAILLGFTMVVSMLPTTPLVAYQEGESSRSASGTASGTTLEAPHLTSTVYDLDSDGTKDQVYEIANAAQLEWFADHVNHNNCKSNAVLVADIDLTGYTHTPIGVNYSDFKGIFDGRGYTVSNMNFTTVQNGYNNHPTYDYQGLFGVMRDGAVVRNVTVKGEVVLSADGQKYVGGVVGLAYEGSLISNVVSYVNINDAGKAYKNIAQVGGVVGQIGNYRGESSATVENSKYYGTMHIDTASSVGGIAGQGVQNSTVANCSNHGTIGWNYIGHIAGIIGSAQTGTKVRDCINYGAVNCHRNDCVGGVAGYANQNVLITNCVNMGDVTAQKSTIAGEPDVYVGGILGYVNNADFGGLTGCLNFGTVKDGDGKNTNTGAIVGLINSATKANVIKDNNWLTSSCVKAYGKNGSSDDQNTTEVDESKTGSLTAAKTVTDSTTMWTGGWYVASGNITISSRVTVTGDVKLILEDEANLTVNGGIYVGGGNSFSVYGESAPVWKEDQTIDESETTTGRLMVENVGDYMAGIGGNHDATTGNVTINGGRISVSAGIESAGIGAGYSGEVSDFLITINDGEVKATGSVGIGGASFANGGRVVINGGNVVAKTIQTGASGIGSGSSGTFQSVVINGGRIEARGLYGAGIGSGSGSNREPASIDEVVINGGYIMAICDVRSGCGIGDADYGTCKKIMIKGGMITAQSGSNGDAGISADTIALEDFQQIEAIGKYDDCMAFGKEPVVREGLTVCLSYGTSIENLTKAERPDVPKLCIEHRAIRLERCHHEKKEISYQDEHSHQESCKYCNMTESVPHVFNEEGLCSCNRWSGTYLDYDSANDTFVTKTIPIAVPVSSSVTKLTSGWYVVVGNVKRSAKIVMEGDVHLILADQSYLGECCLQVMEGGSLTIYGQSQPVVNRDGSVDETKNKAGVIKARSYVDGYAAIGGGANQNSGAITINGGVINAMAGLREGASIGGGDNGVAGAITINGGLINATGDVSGGRDSARIGSAEGGTFTTITINGGIVRASNSGSGIGNGYGSSGGTVIINGGKIHAQGGWNCAGIDAQSIRINKLDEVTAVGGSNQFAFSIQPTVASDISFKVSGGTDSENLKVLGVEQVAAAYTSMKAIRMEMCDHLLRYTYEDGNVHHVSCKWCGKTYTEAHDYDAEGLCICQKSIYDYLEFNTTTWKYETKSCSKSVLLDDTDVTWKTGWYVAEGNVTIPERVVVDGQVHLILLDGASLTITGGIQVQDNDSDITNGSTNSLTIYAQSQPVMNSETDTVDEAKTTTGKLTIQGVSEGNAGIGGSSGGNGGTVTVNGGILQISGGGAGIGGGGSGGNGGTIILNGGMITANGGPSGAGIGGGYEGSGGNVTINGGTVNANSGNNGGAGIGGGSYGSDGDVIINGGTVIAKGYGGSGIGKGSSGTSGGTVTINDFDKIVAVNRVTDRVNTYAFTVTPIFNNPVNLHISVGNKLDALTELEYTKISNTIYTANRAVVIEKCNHSQTILEHEDEQIHKAICVWCGGQQYTEEHSFDGKEDCVCGSKKINYLGYNEESKCLEQTTYIGPCTQVTTAKTQWKDGWYYVKGELDITERVTVSGTVHLVLCDGASLTVSGGIGVNSGNSLVIYGQSQPVVKDDGVVDEANNKTGKLATQGVGSYYAGIGGEENVSAGSVIINGGVIDAIGGMRGAGIGGGKNASGGTIKIRGGCVIATGNDGGAGIGNGYNGSRVTITIDGGVVAATGGYNAVGIGAGRDGSEATIAINGFEQIMAIWGGGEESPKAFSDVPTFAEGMKIRVMKGTSTESLALVNYNLVETTYTSENVVRILQCTNHTENTFAEYMDENSHSLICMWCGSYVGNETHCFDDEQGCSCNIWKGHYLDYDDVTGSLVNNTTRSVPLITDEKTQLTEGWYAVCGKVTLKKRLVISGDVHLILVDGAELIANGGIQVQGNTTSMTEGISETGNANKLSIYAQSDPVLLPNGSLDATNSKTGKLTTQNIDGRCAGIGGNDKGSCGEIVINGGVLSANGGSRGAGVGGGCGGSSGKITINGGFVTAIGGLRGAGVGNGENGTGGTITIDGGTIMAYGGQGATGIGEGDGSSGIAISITGMGRITAVAGEDSGSKKPGAFGVLPVIPDEIKIRVSKGTSIDSLALVSHELAEVTYTGEKVVCLQKCDDHTESVLEEYLDENSHNLICKWCGSCTGQEEHTFSEIKGCRCNVWKGSYLDYDSETNLMTVKTLKKSIPLITSENTQLKDGWYVVCGDVTIEKRLVIVGDVHLIFADGANLTVNGGIQVNADATESTGETAITKNANKLTIYAQSEPVFLLNGLLDEEQSRTGRLTVENVANYYAGIGSNNNRSCGEITINGGIIETTGGDYGAGIGGGYGSSGGTINIRGGNIIAKGGVMGVGIGSYYDGGMITVDGGVVKAIGGEHNSLGRGAAGIGNSYTYKTGGTSIRINGGIVTAVGASENHGFSNAPALNTSVLWKLSFGENMNALSIVDHAEKKDELYEANTVAKVEVCKNHNMSGYTFKNENSHGVFCKWCGAIHEEGHAFDENGLCACDARKVPYLAYNTETNVFETKTTAAKIMTSVDAVLQDGWYVVKDDVTISSRVTVNGDVKLILADGADLIVNGGIAVQGTNSLTVYAQSHPILNSDGTVNESKNKAGKLTAQNVSNGYAGIGGEKKAGGRISIHGGVIKTTGGYDSAGIGGGSNGAGGTIIINGGSITATGGDYAAGIGGGYLGAGGTIIINGGSITATGRDYAAGIGGGYLGAGGTIIINGGSITATGGEYAAGIGDGCDSSGAVITITGFEQITAVGGEDLDMVKVNAFSTVPTFANGVKLRVSRGASIDSLVPVRYHMLSNAFTSAKVMYMLNCRDHTENVMAEYIDESVHNLTCQWCGTGSVTETHAFDDNHTCRCNVWKGNYLDYDSEAGRLTEKMLGNHIPMVMPDDYQLTDGWYVVVGKVTLNQRLIVAGDVHLILADGAELIANGGIQVQDNSIMSDEGILITENTNQLTVYAQSVPVLTADGSLDETKSKTGKLTAQNVSLGSAAIGGTYHESGSSSGKITINGGVISAKGGNMAAGIGGGNRGSGGVITINGGMITTNTRAYGAGIGGGNLGQGGTITINGGTVRATGGQYGAGIGGGSDASGGVITIRGGKVTAAGGLCGVGIGDGDASAGGTIIIDGGIVTAIGGEHWTAGMAGAVAIGHGYNYTGSEVTNVRINGGLVTAIGSTGSFGFSNAPTLKDTISWKVSAGADVETLTEVASPTADTYTENRAVRIYDGVTEYEIISADISWTSMEFTYTDGQWNSETHTYADGGWSTAGGVITVMNRGDVSVAADFSCDMTVNNVTGAFTKSSFTIEPMKGDSTTLSLTGQPEKALNKATLGTVTVTIRKVTGHNS